MADKHNIVHMVGLQARANPTIRRLKDMIQDGVIGRVLAVNAVVSLPAFPTANGTVDLAHAYLLDQANGADQLTIGAAHILDPIEYMVAPLSEVSAKLDTQFADVSVLENGQTIQADAPDHVLIAGTLTQGAHVSIQVVNGGASGFTMRLIGSDGEIAITPQDGLMFQMGHCAFTSIEQVGKQWRYLLPRPASQERTPYRERGTMSLISIRCLHSSSKA